MTDPKIDLIAAELMKVINRDFEYPVFIAIQDGFASYYYIYNTCVQCVSEDLMISINASKINHSCDRKEEMVN